MKTYKELLVWQKATKLSVIIYQKTRDFPKSEIYGLTSQMRRAAVSIASNIAEGHRRGHKSEYIQFLRVSFSSGAELETQLIIAKEIGYLKQDNYNQISNLLTEVMKMLNKFIQTLL